MRAAVEFTEDQARGVHRARYVGGRKRCWPHETELRREAGARLLASTALAELVAAVMPTAVRAVMPAIALLARGNAAHATCNPNGTIDDTNGAIVLGVGTCATASGMTATVVSGATVTAAGNAVTTTPVAGWTLTNQGAINIERRQRSQRRRVIYPHKLRNDYCRCQWRAERRWLDRH